MNSHEWIPYHIIAANAHIDLNVQHSIPMEELLYIGDTLIDDCIQENQSPKLLKDILDGRIQTKSAHKFISQVEKVPEWVDYDSIQRGQSVYWKNIAAIHFILLYGALAGGYAVSRMNQVLIKTGYLSDSKRNFKRLIDTARMIYDVMSDKDALKVGNRGWKSVLQVRFMHGLVRYRQKSNTDKVIPINQTDMIATILAFQIVVIIGLPDFWIHLSPQEKQDYTHLWRYVAYLIGVEEDYNVLSGGVHASASFFKEYSEKCMFKLSCKDSIHLDFTPDNSGIGLTKILLESVSEHSPLPLGLNYALARFFMKKRLADALHIPKSHWSLEYKVFSLRLLFLFLGLIAYIPFFTDILLESRKRAFGKMLKVIK